MPLLLASFVLDQKNEDGGEGGNDVYCALEQNQQRETTHA